MSSRKFVVLLLVTVMAFVVFGAFGSAAQAKFRVAMVTDIGGLGDQSFNDAAWRGLQRADKELGVDVKVVESKVMGDYETNLRSLADQKYDMIWAIGFLMTDALSTVAQQYPNTKFGIIDSVVDQPNVMSVTFKEEEGSFLVGLIAGSLTKKNKVGFIGGMEFPLIIKFEAGFRAGVAAANKKIDVNDVLVGYTGKFDDPGKGKELAMTQFSQGADVIYSAAGACGIGAIEAAKEKKFYAIGVDSDQSHLAPNNVAASMIKRVDVGVFKGIEAFVKGKFKAGLTVMGLAQDGVGVAYSPGVKVPDSVKKLVDSWEKKITSGQYKVPSTREELK